jgi:cell pole-organizing protein PopZ
MPTPAPAPAPKEVRPSDSIFSESAREAVQKAFARAPEPEESFDARDDAGPELPGIDRATVEAVFMRAIRESFGPVAADYLRDHSDDIYAKMTPLLRDWMDRHFPPLLERAVRAEVARVVDDHFPALVRSEVERAVKNRR